jgi:proteasome assembly chaperone (PAC2) family protein
MDPIRYLDNPALRNPVLVAAFGGWANAGEVATGTVDYLIQHLGATELAVLACDDFYLFSVHRPLVTITNGHLKRLDMPHGRFHAWSNSQGPDLILFRGPEPQIRWQRYVELFLDLCRRFQVTSLVILGGLHDEVLHTEERISAAAASIADIQDLRRLEEPVDLIDYVGPCAIHSLLLLTAREQHIHGISLWAHAASYLEGTNYKLCAAMIRRLELLLDFHLDTTELELSWKLLEDQIEKLIGRNQELRQHVEELQRKKRRGSFRPQPPSASKVIRLDPFSKQRKQDE